MSDLTRRIKLSIKIFQELASLIKDEEELEKINNSLASLKHYLEDDFSEFDKEEQEKLSLMIFNDAIHVSLGCLEALGIERLLGREEQEMTKEEVQNKLIQEYMDALNSGRTDVQSLNINEWLEQNCIKIIEDESSTNG